MHGVVLYMVGVLGLFWSQAGSGFQFKPSAGLLLPNMGQVPLHGEMKLLSFFQIASHVCPFCAAHHKPVYAIWYISKLNNNNK